jgi:hypothetical protein
MQVHIGEALYNEMEIHEQFKYEAVKKFKQKGLNEEFTIYRLKDLI